MLYLLRTRGTYSVLDVGLQLNALDYEQEQPIRLDGPIVLQAATVLHLLQIHAVRL